MKKTVKKARSKTTRKRLITPEDLLRFQTLSDAQVSPDGGNVIFTHKVVSEKNAYHTNLWIVPTNAKGQGAQPRAFTSGNRDSRGRWSPDGRTVAFISARESKAKPQIYLMPVTGGEARKLTNFPEGTINGYRWSPDGTMLAVRFREQAAEWTEDAKKQREQKGLTTPARVIDDWWYRLDGDGYFGAQRFHLYIVDVATGAHRVIYNKDTLGFFDFDFSPDSRYIALTSNRNPKAMVKPWATELLRLNVATGSVARIPNVPQGTKSAVRWSPDGRLIAWAGREGVDDTYSTENLHLYVCDARTGRTQNLTGKEDYCLLAAALSDTADAAFEANIQWSRDSKRIFMQLGWHGETHVASIPAKGGEIAMHTAGPYAHQMGNLSSDGSLIALTRGSTTALDEVHIARTGKARFNPTRLTNLNGPLLSTLKLSVPQDHWIEAADGTRVHVWTMNPANYSPRQKHPAILEIHGGPHAQYGVGFFHEFQVLAAAGYMVVYSNPRGSKGYGRDHCAAIRGAWGGNDWADIQAVIRFMRHRKDINPRKMGVMGGSYGGYM
ncbi:MAG TPA: S9 family peptidase, partial [Phycisphaerales bacterium]|nr:S9 family peptidase [Phycisphaerales bacterium]